MTKWMWIVTALVTTMTITACGKSDATATQVSDEAIKQYILNNPEVIVESLTKYQQQMSEVSDEEANEILSKMDKDIYKNPNSPVYGNPDGKDVIVEFFDYNCGYCKKMTPDIIKLVEENKDLKIIFKELPVLGPTSEATALAALVVHDIAPEKYFAFHNSLMSHQGPLNEQTIREAAVKAGVEADVILSKITDQKYKDILDKNTEIARSLKISGTPTFIANGKILRGAAGYDALKAAIE